MLFSTKLKGQEISKVKFFGNYSVDNSNPLLLTGTSTGNCYLIDTRGKNENLKLSDNLMYDFK